MTDIDKLIADCVRNKRKAQLQLYNRYSSMLLGICTRYVHDRSEAEDILQEGFLKILKNITEFSGAGHFENWMRKIMVNTAISHFHREKKHYYHSEIDDIKDDEVQVDLSPDKKIEFEELKELLKAMPDGYRVIFNLYAIEGYKHKEIAEQLQIDESTSKSQYLRAKKWIIKEMEKQNWL